MAILTLAEYRLLSGTDVTYTLDDAQITALLPAASLAVQTYAGRNFEAATSGSAQRSFLYDGSGFLDIDDCTGVAAVDVVVPNVTDPITVSVNEYTAMPDNGLVSYYLVIHGGISPFAISPEMGFERNLDTFPIQTYKAPTIRVTATWGWPAVPADVKLATTLTVSELLSATSSTNGEGVSSEAIEGWSRSWGGRGIGGGSAGVSALAIPNRARDLLAAYQRVSF